MSKPQAARVAPHTALSLDIRIKTFYRKAVLRSAPMPPAPPIHRLPLDPNSPYTTPRPWAPLTEGEWNILGSFLARMDCGMSFRPRRGRPPEDVRARLDAIFRAVTIKAGDGGRAPWRALPQNFGKADTVSRTFRRWARLGLWQKLLEEAASPGAEPELRRCRCFHTG
jgi:transposase